ERLEIAADGHRFCDYGAVVEHQRRNPLHWVDRSVLRRALLQGAEIYLFRRNGDALFGQEDTHPAGIRRAPGIIKLHRHILLYLPEHTGLSPCCVPYGGVATPTPQR